MATVIYIIWLVTFLPFHLMLSSALAEAVLSCCVIADVVAIAIYFVPSIPGGVPFIALVVCFVLSMIIYAILFHRKVRMIKTILTVVDPDMTEEEKFQAFDAHRLDRDEKYAIMFLTVGFTEMCDCLLDWSLVHYIADHFDTNNSICSLVQIMAFFPGESRKLNSLFGRALKRRDLEIQNRFLIYQVYRINTLRQSSTSLQASEKLSELISHVFIILLHISAAILLFGIGIVTAGVELVDRKLGMMPIHDRIIETDPQSLGTESIDELADDVLAVRGIHHVIVGIFGIEQTKSLVVLGCQNRVFHSRQACATGEIAGIKKIGIEVFEIKIVFGIGYFFVLLYPFVTSRHCVKPEMNKHTKSIVHQPRRITGSLATNI